MGFSGSLTPFYDHYKYLSDGHRGYRSKNWKPDAKKEKPKDNRSELLPVKSIASVIDMALKGKNMDKSQQTTFDILRSLGWFTEMYEAMKSFCKVIKGCETVELVRWIKRYFNITNGITEGFVNKLKAIKRSMYGKAGLELLKNKLVIEHVLFN